ncbi:MAG: Transposon Tn10 TetD protein [Chlamydiia bacterium]|nr:Transposon Tn10 TetD protein [Chlamydiia bacterium]
MVKDDKTANFHIQGILKAQLYIQENLDSKISLKRISQIAGFSPYHFHRIFHAYSDESLNNYVRRLRMEKSAGKIKYDKDSITEIAMDSGYETPQAFLLLLKKSL